jgi:ComF family protein
MRVLDYIYPKVRCACCNNEIFDDQILCKDCIRNLENIRRPHLIKGELIRGHVLYYYEDPVKQMILNFKYQDARYLGDLIAEKIAETVLKIEMEFDVVIPVPSHYIRRWFRGYNQSEILARLISERTQIPLDTKYLQRKIPTMPMKELDKVQRLEMIGDAFNIRGIKAYRKILLIDDIYTTGATIDSCGRVLFEGGADEIVFVVFSGND